jgi:nicotinamide mononucleotide (NMN) deamidase PncC
VIYTAQAREALLGITAQDMAGMRSASEAYALLLARRVREKHGADWGLAETGAAGPTGNRYGDAAGHSCIAVVGPGVERVITLETGSADRRANMRRFAQGAFGLANKTIG